MAAVSRQPQQAHRRALAKTRTEQQNGASPAGLFHESRQSDRLPPDQQYKVLFLLVKSWGVVSRQPIRFRAIPLKSFNQSRKYPHF
jgi:hypothetical protein